MCFIIINNFIGSLYFLLAKINEILQIWVFPVRLNYFVSEGLLQEGLQRVREYKTDNRHTHLQKEEHQKTQRVLKKKINSIGQSHVSRAA